MAKKNPTNGSLEPQKSSAAQFLTYIASVGESNEKFELRYEDENIWMSQKLLAAVYGVEIPNIAYHLRFFRLVLSVDQTNETAAIIGHMLVCEGERRR